MNKRHSKVESSQKTSKEAVVVIPNGLHGCGDKPFDACHKISDSKERQTPLCGFHKKIALVRSFLCTLDTSQTDNSSKWIVEERRADEVVAHEKEDTRHYSIRNGKRQDNQKLYKCRNDGGI